MAGLNYSVDHLLSVAVGTASPVTTAHQNRYPAETINRYRAGHATYIEVPGMDAVMGEKRL